MRNIKNIFEGFYSNVNGLSNIISRMLRNWSKVEYFVPLNTRRISNDKFLIYPRLEGNKIAMSFVNENKLKDLEKTVFEIDLTQRAILNILSDFLLEHIDDSSLNIRLYVNITYKPSRLCIIMDIYDDSPATDALISLWMYTDMRIENGDVVNLEISNATLQDKDEKEQYINTKNFVVNKVL